MVRFSALVAVVSLAATSTPVAAKCAMSHLRPKVITTSSIVGGGIVVATEQVGYDVKDEGDARQPTWKLEMGGATTAPKIETLAPGLVLYRLPASAGTATLLDGKTTIARVTTTKDKPAPLPAPKATGIRLDKSIGRRSSTYIRVKLDGAAPAGMVALVLSDAKGTPLSFGLVTKDPELEVYAHSRCGVVPNDTVEAASGAKVTLRWVDESGRMSPPSAVMTITGKPTTLED